MRCFLLTMKFHWNQKNYRWPLFCPLHLPLSNQPTAFPVSINVILVLLLPLSSILCIPLLMYCISLLNAQTYTFSLRFSFTPHYSTTLPLIHILHLAPTNFYLPISPVCTFDSPGSSQPAPYSHYRSHHPSTCLSTMANKRGLRDDH